MAVSSPPRGVTRFGVFQLDAHSRELRKNGIRIKLQQQPLQILSLLLERPGEVVTREQLRERLWPGDVYVDFDRGLNKAIGKLRDALGDSADSPHFIETLPKIGYRFVAPVAPAISADSSGDTGASASESPASKAENRRKWLVATVLAGLLGSAVMVALLLGFSPSRVPNRLWRAGNHPVHAIAVLPLTNLSGDPTQEYFVDGMTDELITSLARLGDVQVISRTSVMQYKNAKKPLPQIGRELNVDAIIEGSVSRSGPHVRITAQLVDAVTDQHIWAQTYERDLGDVLMLQDEAARDIAQEVHVRIRSNPGDHPSRVRPVNPEAYEAYLKGRYFWQKHTDEDFKRAIGYFEQAIQADPGYAAAYAGLADVYQDQVLFAEAAREVEIPKARAAVQKALELDDNLSEAHDALAGILEQDWDWKGAEREHIRALELNPNNANAHLFYANHLAARGRFDQAVAEFQLTQRLDPLSPFAQAVGGWIFYDARQDDRAIAQFRKALEIDPTFGMAHQGLYRAYSREGKKDEAIRELFYGEDDSTTRAELDEAYRTSGITGLLRESLKLNRQSRMPMGPLELASLHARLGENAEAIGYLQQCVKSRSPGLMFLKVGPDWDNLRSDPRFQEIVRSVGLPE
ncbi:MAG: tetratricopeptide repeat protein [Terriglobales bacterium]